MTPGAAAGTALALSPHLDDAVFSAGATLFQLARAGWRVVVATVFTRSVPNPQGFALACQLDKGLAPDIDYMALRRDEDAAACTAVGAEPRWLSFPEAPHRGYESAPALFAGLHGDDVIIARITPTIEGLIAELRPALVLAPQAIGGHVDHEAVVRALDRIQIGAPVLWWRDYPYTMRGDQPSQPFRGRFAEMREHVVQPTNLSRAAKRDASLAYRSQLGFQFGGADELRQRLADGDGGERFRSTTTSIDLRLT